MVKFRDFIFVKQGNLTSDEFDDSRFDNDVKVKDEVIEWLSRMEARNNKAHEIVPLARLMLAQAEDRPTAASVSDSLRKVMFLRLGRPMPDLILFGIKLEFDPSLL